MPTKRKLSALFLLYLALATLSLFIAVAAGSADISLMQVFGALSGSADHSTETIVMRLRLERGFSAFFIGGMLALAGVMMQNLLRNPLADPYILGISGGAALSALIALSLGIAGLALELSSLCGAFFASAVLWKLSKSLRADDGDRLILIGVVLSAGFAALLVLTLAIHEGRQLRSMLFWLMGDLSFSSRPLVGLFLLCAIAAASMWFARSMDILTLGATQAKSLGLHVDAFRLFLFAAAAVLTAFAVSQAGTIGFIGLMVPHLVRLQLGNAHRLVIPASIILGGSLLTLADTFSRTAFAPKQLPVGAITALIGVPVFFYLLSKTKSLRS